VSVFYNDIKDILLEQYTSTEENAQKISYNYTVSKTSWIVSFLEVSVFAYRSFTSAMGTAMLIFCPLI